MNVKTIDDVGEFSTEEFLKAYKFQKYVTEKLDNREEDFNQQIINEIVLWKVNRYTLFTEDVFALINDISPSEKYIDVEKTKRALRIMLPINGVRLPMASTILRFRNPNIYQLIDQRVYRFVYKDKILKITNKYEEQIDIYLDYLSVLKEKCAEYSVPFADADRILYQMDKVYNKDKKILY